MMSLGIKDTSQKPLFCQPPAFGTGLLGTGQDDLPVMLSILIIQANLSLSVWVALLMLGSILFLSSFPCRGKQISRTGSKPVMLWALGRYGASSTLLRLGSMLMVTSAIATAVELRILIIAQATYGLTMPAIVSACRVWALQRARKGDHITVLAAISSDLSCGRLFGSLCVATMLVIHPLVPLGLPIATPVLALLMLLRLPGTPSQPAPERRSVSLKRGCLPYLFCAILPAVAVNIMQLGLSFALTRQLAADTTAISQQVTWLLGPSTIAVLTTQFGVLRPQRLTPTALLLSVEVLMSGDLAIMLSEQLWLFHPGCIVLSFGIALTTPAHQLLLNDKLADGTGAGWLAISHTLGHGLRALLASLVSEAGIAIVLIMAALFATTLFTIVSVFTWHCCTIK